MEPHVYVLHLKHRVDRKQQFTAAWAAAGIHSRPHWFPAVLGTALSNATLANFRTAARTRKARAGRVGCYCSHVAAMEHAIKHDHFPLLILEDDAIPTGPLDLAALFASAPPTAKLLYFGALPVRNRRPVRVCSRKRRWHSAPRETQLYGGHAYGIPSATAASELVAFLKEHRMTFDSALIRYTKAHPTAVYIHCPFVFVQAEGYSNIEHADRPQR